MRGKRRKAGAPVTDDTGEGAGTVLLASTRTPPLKERSRKYPPAKIIEALKQTRGMITAAARVLGCERKTIYNAARSLPAVKQAIEEERELMLDFAEMQLFRAVNEREAWAVCFYLKTQGKVRGYIERQEMSGPSGGPIQVEGSVTFYLPAPTRLATVDIVESETLALEGARSCEA